MKSDGGKNFNALHWFIMDFKIYPKEADEINNTPRFAICDGCGNVVYNYSIKIFSIVYQIQVL